MDKKTTINWSGRAFDYSDQEIAVLVDAARHADPLTQGRYLEEFQKRFGEYLGVKHCFAVANATNGLDLAAMLSRLKPGDEVIVPGHTFCATAIPFGRTGATLVWADIDPDTRLISAHSVRKLVSNRTKVIVPVHLYGLMADMVAINDIAQEHGLLVVEDCAQAIGAELNGKKAGTYGDFAVFSFHGQKSLTTLGEGGVMVVKSDELAAKTPGLRHNGVRPFAQEREHYWIPAMSNVDLDIEGLWPVNVCLGEPQCALASKLLERLDGMNEERIRRAEYFRKELADFTELTFQKVPSGYKHVYHLLSAKYDGRKYGKSNHDFIKSMFYDFSIKVIVQYYPLYRYPLFKKMGFGDANCPHTDEFFDNMVSFPFHVWMSDDELSYMLESAKKTLKKLRGGKP